MLKGHATIELTNVHTGKKEVVEHDNLITNAVSDHMNKVVPFLSQSDFASRFTPLRDAAMGGILLFENQLEVSPDNTKFPYNNGLTGYASNDANNTTDTKRGSRNLTESMKLSNGYKYVWDFATSQANGTISALALTSKEGGANPYKAFSSIYDGFSSGSGYMTDYDFTSDIFHTITYTTIDNTNKLYGFIERTYRNIRNNISINDTFGKTVLLSTKEHTSTISDYPTSTSSGTWFAKYQNNYYVVVHTYSYSTSAYTPYLFRINADTLEYDSSYGVKKIDILVYGQSYRSNIVIDNGYLYQILPLSENSGIYKLIKINISDTSDIEFFDFPSNASSGNIYKFLSMPADGVLMYYYGYFLTTTKTFIEVTAPCSSYAVFGKDELYNGYLYEVKNYLASINNLDVPVTKTPDKTMKITYTVTET